MAVVAALKPNSFLVSASISVDKRLASVSRLDDHLLIHSKSCHTNQWSHNPSQRLARDIVCNKSSLLKVCVLCVPRVSHAHQKTASSTSRT